MAFSHKLGITDSHGYIFVICHAPPSTTTGQKPLVRINDSCKKGMNQARDELHASEKNLNYQHGYYEKISGGIPCGGGQEVNYQLILSLVNILIICRFLSSWVTILSIKKKLLNTCSKIKISIVLLCVSIPQLHLLCQLQSFINTMQGLSPISSHTIVNFVFHIQIQLFYGNHH